MSPYLDEPPPRLKDYLWLAVGFMLLPITLPLVCLLIWHVAAGKNND